MKLFLINVHGQPIQNAKTAYIFRRTHFAVYGRILNEFQSDVWEKKRKQKQNILLRCGSHSAACYDLQLKSIKDALQQIELIVRGKNKKPATSIHAGSSFEGTTGQL